MLQGTPLATQPTSSADFKPETSEYYTSQVITASWPPLIGLVLTLLMLLVYLVWCVHAAAAAGGRQEPAAVAVATPPCPAPLQALRKLLLRKLLPRLLLRSLLRAVRQRPERDVPRQVRRSDWRALWLPGCIVCVGSSPATRTVTHVPALAHSWRRRVLTIYKILASAALVGVVVGCALGMAKVDPQLVNKASTAVLSVQVGSLALLWCALAFVCCGRGIDLALLTAFPVGWLTCLQNFVGTVSGAVTVTVSHVVALDADVITLRSAGASIPVDVAGGRCWGCTCCLLQCGALCCVVAAKLLDSDLCTAAPRPRRLQPSPAA